MAKNLATQKWYSLGVEQVMSSLGSSHEGLSDEEAKKRLDEYGPNELRKEKGISPLALFIGQFKDTLIIILIIAIILSAVIGELTDALIIAVIVLFCGILGFVQEFRAERAMAALKKMLSPTITVLRGGKEEEIPSRDIVPGDMLLLEAGDKIPADARLVEAHSLKCDEASLTGESVPAGKNIKPLPEDIPIGDRTNMAFTGTILAYGRGKAVVVSTGMDTEFGKIAEQVTSVEEEETPLGKRTGEIGKWIGLLALGICALVAVISIIRQALSGGIDLPFIITAVIFAVALAVAAVPEALAAIVTGALAIGMHEMAKRNALVRKMPAVETLGCTRVICSDKTGTLTKGEMTLRKIFTDGKLIDVTGVGYEPVGEFRGSGVINAPTNQSLWLLLQGGLLCSDASLEKQDGKWIIKGDPTEGALVVAAAKAGLDQGEARLKNPRIEELPFSSERKRMTTMHQMENGRRVVFMKGAPEVVLERCSHVLNGKETKALTTEERTRILQVNGEMAQGALRVLGLSYKDSGEGQACTEEYAESDLTFIGLVGMIDPPRAESIEAVKTCKQIGIRPVMITGDHRLTAVAIAKEIGIYQEGDMVITGPELEKMSDEELVKIVDKVTVYARVSPLDKLKVVQAWKAKGEVVAVTGDGVNDAPALKHADIGIAMGITGTEVTKEAADMVLKDDNFATIIAAVERGRWVYDNIKKYLAYLLQCNITEVIVIGGVVLALGPQYLPLLPAAILYMNLATDGLPALALGIAPPDPDIMLRPPRNPKESIFSWDVMAFILLSVVIQVPFYFFLWFHGMGDIVNDRTEMFFLFIVIELVVAINCRSLRYSLFKVPPHKWLLLAIAWELALITVLIQIPAVQDAFGITRPTFLDLAIIVGFGVVQFIAMEIIKVFLRRRAAKERLVTA